MLKVFNLQKKFKFMLILINMNDLKYKIFVYGTLKQNEPNHEELVKRKAKFICKANSVCKWPLIIASECNLPFLLYKINYGKVCRFNKI